MERKELGKIVDAGYSGSYGKEKLFLEFNFNGCCGVGTYIEPKDVAEILSDAKVNSHEELKNKPVQLTLKGQILQDWRILTEVL